MSHFSQIKTQIRSLPALKSALTDLGIDWKPGPREVRGYKGLTSSAEVVIEQDNQYDIGFAWNGQEYELVADLQFWKQDSTLDRFLSKVTQRYAYHTIVSESAQKGFQISEQERNQDGSIRLVLQRWSA
ncbi:MAG: DUF1257 domain-containing protein [Leptolyngbyaceae cyanobacterium CSU_1_3]|nr:DUF1257 domain-containing protein [Leptolyngbyaceae cyanobacterium CSU_1_3]